jgi:hypothetical protein
MSLKTFWGDTHQNCYTSRLQPVPIAEVLSFARTHLDFYSGAYYTPMMTRVSPLPESLAAALPPAGPGEQVAPLAGWLGIFKEGTKPQERIEREWAEFEAAVTAVHEPGRFVSFPGYEWQGDGVWGDHNVMHLREGEPVHTVETLPELYALLKGRDAIAIPHHIGYKTGIRAPDWACCDETITPYAEIFSVHGCSETDEEWLGLRNNPHMGPGLAGSMYQAALDHGLHLGCIASTDNWQNTPGSWGKGLMACQAEDLTRESLWKAFRSRRVYGVTGDRIELDFTCNGRPMGSILGAAPERRFDVSVRGLDAIDRIELLRNGRVIATHCHQGTWEMPKSGTRSRFRIRIETGWGPKVGELPFMEKRWDGSAALSNGRFLGWSPCWTGRGQGVPVLDGGQARFQMTSVQTAVPNPFQVGLVLEFEADPAEELAVALNGQEARDRVAGFAAGSRVLWYKQDSIDRVRELTGVRPEDLDRSDPLYYQLSFKAKLHKAIPEAGYTARLSFVDAQPPAGEANYRVRVEQRNGQRAWSSPIWAGAGR